jgi:hypothetical protein
MMSSLLETVCVPRDEEEEEEDDGDVREVYVSGAAIVSFEDEAKAKRLS